MSKNVVWHKGRVDGVERQALTGGPGATIWLTGLSGSGKSTIGVELERRLVENGRLAYRLDGDNLRHGLNGDLGFSNVDRRENIRRTAEVARLMADAGLICIVSLISPFTSERMLARQVHTDVGLRFVEVFVDTPLEVCEERDPKGLYARARAGEITGMTGIDAPYERPQSPDVRLTPDSSLEDAVQQLLDHVP